MVKISKEEEKPVHPYPPLEWGSWFLWVLASITAGGLFINWTIAGGDDLALGFSTSLAGWVGGILIGLMPWWAQKHPITRLHWWILVCISSAITCLALATIYFFNLPSYSSFYLKSWLLPVLIASTCIAWVSRAIGRRKLHSTVQWWRWLLAVILILLLGVVMFILSIVTILQ